MPPLDRKSRIVAESARLRGEISAQFDAIEESFGWINRGVEVGRQVGKGGLLLTAAGGAFLAWKLLRGKGREEAPREEPSPSRLSRMTRTGFKLAGLAGPLFKILRG